MSVAILIASYVVVFGAGFWAASKAVRNASVRRKLAEDIAIELIDDDLAEHIAHELASRRLPR